MYKHGGAVIGNFAGPRSYTLATIASWFHGAVCGLGLRKTVIHIRKRRNDNVYIRNCVRFVDHLRDDDGASMNAVRHSVMKMPCQGGKVMEVKGKRLWLYVGKDRKVAFFIHNATLSHWASGYRFGSLNEIKVEHMCSFGHNAHLSDRQAAQKLVDKMTLRVGTAEQMLNKLRSAPVINHQEKVTR